MIDINTNGTLYTAQAAGRQMRRFGQGGSIILLASLAGRIAVRVSSNICSALPHLLSRVHGHQVDQHVDCLSYGASKGAVLQMARTMACSLATEGIRVNTISPGWIKTGYDHGLLFGELLDLIARSLTNVTIDSCPAYFERETPMQRVGKAHELRGAVLWLSSDASSYCTGSEYVT